VAVEVIACAITGPPDGATGQRRALYIAKLFGYGALALSVSPIVFVPQLIGWKVVFGDWITTPMGHRL